MGPLSRSGSWGEAMIHIWPWPLVGLTGFWVPVSLLGLWIRVLGMTFSLPFTPNSHPVVPEVFRKPLQSLQAEEGNSASLRCLSPAPLWFGVRVAWSCRQTDAGSHSSGATLQSWCFETCAGRMLENILAPVAPRPPVQPSLSQVGP